MFGRVGGGGKGEGVEFKNSTGYWMRLFMIKCSSSEYSDRILIYIQPVFIICMTQLSIALTILVRVKTKETGGRVRQIGLFNPFPPAKRILTHLQQTTFDNIAAKGEIVQYEQFPLWPQCFQLFSLIILSMFSHDCFWKRLLQIYCMWERVNFVDTLLEWKNKRYLI